METEIGVLVLVMDPDNLVCTKTPVLNVSSTSVSTTVSSTRCLFSSQQCEHILALCFIVSVLQANSLLVLYTYSCSGLTETIMNED